MREFEEGEGIFVAPERRLRPLPKLAQIPALKTEHVEYKANNLLLKLLRFINWKMRRS